MTIALKLSVKTARLTALRDAIDTGTGTAQLTLYDGTRPAAGGAATNALGVADLGSPAGTVSGNVLTLALPDSINAAGDGTVTWARITDKDGNWVIDMDASEDPADDLTITPANVFTGGIINFLTKTLSE
ncbi:hypothetical protein [Methylohalobius crimeensis]|uniref:hypothetical protein n=1 Tax=Methylohalobius crimeensis TaxID=244365 RepID=UPI0003B552AC|nr:hypothetical protein [Methylohalobius crimeensis]